MTWGDTAEESYAATLDAINRAAAFVEERAQGDRRRSRAPRSSRSDDDRTRVLLAEVLPALRGAVSVDGPADPPGRHVAGGARVRLRLGLADALAGRRRVPRPSRAHEAPAGLGRVRSRAPRTRRRCRTGSSSARARMAGARARVLREASGSDDGAERSEPARGRDPGSRPGLGRADAQGRAAGARPLPPRDQRDARRRRARRVRLARRRGVVRDRVLAARALQAVARPAAARVPGHGRVHHRRRRRHRQRRRARAFAACGACVVATDLDARGRGCPSRTSSATSRSPRART